MDDTTIPIKILFVDDERNVLRSLERTFLDDDYEIVTAGSGDEALEILNESGDSFQVVVSDYRMPVMNGVELLKVVYERWPDTVRIVLSGYADAGAIVAAINEGHIYKFIPKPWNDEELKVTIQNCLERYFLLKKNRELLEELAQANQILEEKVQQRTEDLELRNRALEFSQTMLGNLPVGVIGIDEHGLLAHCNTLAATILKQFSTDFLGTDLQHFDNQQFKELVERVRKEKELNVFENFGTNTTWRIMGQTISFAQTEAVVLVFISLS